jgi:predicted Fe-Mo cluster-binding NifX family protein
MNLCIPVNSDSALASEVCPHFGSAPCFLIVDTDSLACRGAITESRGRAA